jgi:enoyl-CoA hydratase/carnithine racemase
MDDGENRWNTTFLRAYSAALDEAEASVGPAALVTASANEKFFSNGLDLEWASTSGEHRGGDRSVFGVEYMAMVGRLITFPIPTVSAMNGHAFGAGLMTALGHDVRIMREDRGYLCANEIEIGLTIPAPELALFRHKLSASAFHETVMLAKRWTGKTAMAAGFVEAVAATDAVLDTAIARAAQLAPLGANRVNLAWQKEQAYGTEAALNRPDGAAHMLKHSRDYPSDPRH